MTFPTAHSQIYRNEAGEVTGWDNPGYDDGPDPDEYYEQAELYNSDDDYDDEDEHEEESESHLPIDPATGRESTGADEIGTASEADDLPDHDGVGDTDQTGEDYDDYHDEPEPREPDDGEVSWQEYGRAEAYHGDYSEM